MRKILSVIGVLLVLCISQGAWGETWYVDDAVSASGDGLTPQTAFKTIQEGIDAAADGDTVLVADGRYTGEGNRDLDLGGKPIVVKSENGPEDCVIDCENEPYVWGFRFGSEETWESVVDGFTIMGPIWCQMSSPTIRNNVITGSAGMGGINCVWASSPLIVDCHIRDNSAEEFGGGISVLSQSSPTIQNNTITGNSAISGVSCPGKFAAKGGGIFVGALSSATIQNNVIAENRAELGGAIYCADALSVLIRNNTIVANSARGGGAIQSEGCSPTITNNIIALSEFVPLPETTLCPWSYTDVIRTYVYEGAILVGVNWNYGFSNDGVAGWVTIEGCGMDESLYVEGGERYKLVIRSTAREDCFTYPWCEIIDGGIDLTITPVDNPAGGLNYKEGDCRSSSIESMESGGFWQTAGIAASGGEATITYCDLYDNDGGNYILSGGEVDLAGKDGNISEDPLFVDAPGGDYRLLAGSPCIDVGINEDWMSDAVDLDGKPRVLNGTVDMGAYEYEPLSFNILEVLKGAGGEAQLTWKSRPGDSYIVCLCTDLCGEWSEGATIASQGETTTWSDPDTVSTRKFYRIGIE